MRVAITAVVEEDEDRVLVRAKSRGGEPFTFPLVYGPYAEQTRAIVEQVRAGETPVVELPFDELDDD